MAASVGEVELAVVPNLATFGPLLASGLKGSLSGVAGLLKGAFSDFGAVAGVAFAAAAAASIASAVDYERAFTKIDAITNASSQEIEQWKQQVLDMAGETAQAPVALADSLYYLASAGLKAGQPMEALQASAQAASMGMGQAADIARITAQALNAYSESGLTVTQVMDALTAAIREGTAEPEEFAVALGRVLPVANQAGVAFDEVVASLSSMSNVGLDVDEGVTALRQLLLSIAAPTVRAANALASMGISTNELRDVLSKEGVLGALKLLMKATGGNIDQLRVLIPNVRALSGALNLAGDSMKDNKKIMDEVTNSQGDFAEAWRVTTQNISFQLKQLWNSFKVLAVVIGEALMPIFKVFVGALKALGVLLGPIARNADLVFYAFMAWGAFKVLPTILFGIARGLMAMGLGQAALNAGMLAEGLGAAAAKAGPLKTLLSKTVFTPPGAVITATAIGLAWGIAGDKARRAANEITEASSGLQEFATGPGQAVLKFADGTTYLTGETGKLRDAQLANAAMADRWTAAAMSGYGAAKFLGKQVEHDAYSFKQFIPQVDAASNTLEAAGYSADEFLKAAIAAADKGKDAFNKFSAEALGKVSDALTKMQQDISSNINFTIGALGRLSERSKATAEDYLKQFQKAREQTKAFGKDLLEIAHHGGEALAQQLISMGENGVNAARVIAGASGKMRDKLINSFNAGQSAADKLATKLTTAIAGTLESIENILRAIAKEWEIDVNVKGNAKKDLSVIKGMIDGLPAEKSIAIDIHRNYIDTLTKGGKAEGGSVLRNTPYVVGEKGPELFVPGVSGTIVPNDKLRAATATATGSRPVAVRVALDRRRVLEETDYEYRYRGW